MMAIHMSASDAGKSDKFAKPVVEMPRVSKSSGSSGESSKKLGSSWQCSSRGKSTEESNWPWKGNFSNNEAVSGKSKGIFQINTRKVMRIS